MMEKERKVCEIDFSVLQCICRHHNQITDVCGIDVNTGVPCSVVKCPFVDVDEREVVKEKND